MIGTTWERNIYPSNKMDNNAMITLEILREEIESKVSYLISQFDEDDIDSELADALKKIGIDLTKLNTGFESSFLDITKESFETIFPGSFEFFFDEHNEILEGIENSEIKYGENFTTDLKAVSGLVIITFCDRLDLEELEEELERKLSNDEINLILKPDYIELEKKALLSNFNDTIWAFELTTKEGSPFLRKFERAD